MWQLYVWKVLKSFISFLGGCRINEGLDAESLDSDPAEEDLSCNCAAGKFFFLSCNCAAGKCRLRGDSATMVMR